jgi:hypothetical protein
LVRMVFPLPDSPWTMSTGLLFGVQF